MSSKSAKQGAGEAVYTLPRVLEIADIGKVYQDMLQFTSEPHGKLTLDAGEIALVDAAGVQLVVQFLRFLRGNDCEVSWSNDSIQLLQAAAELGLDDALEA